MSAEGARRKVDVVSVVITSYNYGRFLDPCIPSVLGQTYRDIEVVLVDDGSTDDTEALARRWVDEPRFRYVRQSNRGPSAARNAGIERARGEFVAFLDADDYWRADKLEKQMHCFEKPGTGVVYSRSRYVDPQGRDNGFVLSGDYLTPRRGRVTEYLVFDNFIPMSSSIVRRECLERCGTFDEGLPLAMDWDLWLRLSTRYEFDYVDEPLLVYRMGHENQLSQNLELRQAWCATIQDRFLAAHTTAISVQTRRRARAYAMANRGYYFEPSNRPRALHHYLSSIGQRPLQVVAYKGLMRALLPRRVVNSLREGRQLGSQVAEAAGGTTQIQERYLSDRKRTITGRAVLAVANVPLWPLMDGHSLRVRSLLEHLAADWTVLLVAPRDEPINGRVPNLDALAERIVLPLEMVHGTLAMPVPSVRHAFAGFAQKLLDARRPDVVLLWPGADCIAFGGPGMPPVVADRIDCQSLTQWRRLLHGRGVRERIDALHELLAVTRYERKLARAAAATVVVGPDDARALRAVSGVERIFTVPNGVRADPDWSKLVEAPQPTVAFTGVLSFGPNMDAARYFAEQVWPLVKRAVPLAEFVIAGKTPTPDVQALASLPGVTVLADVPDMGPVIARAWVCVAPMRTGSGIKNKVLEAWSKGKPVVLTRLAANGLRLDATASAWVASTASEMAEMTIRLLESSSERRRVGGEAYWLVASRHTWEHAADELSEILERVGAEARV